MPRMARPVKCRDRWRIRWLDADGVRRSAVFEKFADADKALVAWRADNPLPYVFPNETGGMNGPSARVLQEILHRVLAAAGFPKRASPSASARVKKRRKQTPDGFPVHSFQTLLSTLATQARLTCRVASMSNPGDAWKLPGTLPDPWSSGGGAASQGRFSKPSWTTSSRFGGRGAGRPNRRPGSFPRRQQPP